MGALIRAYLSCHRMLHIMSLGAASHSSSTAALLEFDNQESHEGNKPNVPSPLTALQPSLLRGLKPSDSALCPRCRLLDFDYVGFHFSPSYNGNNYSVQRDFASLLATCKICVFCWRLVTILTEWLARNVKDSAGLDLEDQGWTSPWRRIGILSILARGRCVHIRIG